MKKIILPAIVALSALSPAARAQQAVVCANCSSFAEQALQYAKEAQSALTQAQQLQGDLQRYALMVTNTTALPQQIWANVQGDLMQVRSLANAGSLLTGYSGSILTRLQSAQGYASQAMTMPGNLGNQLTSWQQTFGNAATSLARTLGVQQGQESNYTALQAAIQTHSQTAAGQMQAIQAGNESLALLNTQFQQVQATLVAAAQETATKDVVATDRRAAEDAQFQQLFAQPQAVPMTGNPTVQFQ